MAESSAVRNRKPVSEKEDPAGTEVLSHGSKKAKAKLDEEDKYSPWVDILRVITFLIFASCALSYLISNGESWFWGMKNKPRYLRVDWWKSQFAPPLILTPEELATYDGTDPEKPIYLAIDGIVYDVTPGARMYGPGGSYHFFAGADASRGFVTGCFADDRTPDLRGVEEMFLPVNEDGLDLSRYYTDEELEQLYKEELDYANQRVQAGLQHWVQFFSKSDKYLKVGKVQREDGWLEKTEPPKLCASAVKGRPKRKIPQDRKPRW